jgi:hypothetical protein
MSGPEYRGAAPRIPAATREWERDTAEIRERRAEGEQVERRRQLRGLLALAGAVLVFSVVRAGAGNVFPQGWWRIW